MNEIVYVNGAFLPVEEAAISVLDYGFLFGYGLYETTRTYSGRCFRLSAHLQRLEKAARALSIPADITQFETLMRETVRRNPLGSGRLRLTLTPGPGSAASDISTCHNPTVLCMHIEYRPHSPEVYARGLSVILSDTRRNSQSILPGMKASAIVESMLAKQQARLSGYDDALLLNDQGRLAEASSSNMFMVSQGILKTPRTGDGLLPGTTRQVVFELAGQLPIECCQCDISPEELAVADELFITNAMIEIMPVTRLDGKAIGRGQSGEFTRRLSRAYRELVEKELN
jgi:branched-chain amino acid aminotransferase